MQLNDDSKPRRILVVDDSDAIHSDFKKTLGGDRAPTEGFSNAKKALFGTGAENAPVGGLPKFEMESALQGQDGLNKVVASIKDGKPFNVAFVDMRMPPGWDGVQTIQKLWQADPDLEVVICTAYSDYSWEEISKKLGLTDRLLILKKPFDPIEVSQLAASLSEKWVLKRHAQLKNAELERMVEQRTSELTHLALHDKLTGLPNRALLKDRITQAIARRERNLDYNFAVLFLDFDRFKLVNDSLGHDFGDELLVQISQRLAQSVRATDSICIPANTTAARLGGDEFVILAEDLKEVSEVTIVVERLLNVLSEPYELNGHTISSTASIGVTTSAVGYTRAEDMVRDADTAMYHAKAAGRARYVLFDRKMHEEIRCRLELENELRNVVEKKQLVLYYQPVVSLGTNTIQGFEALVRWKHPQRGVLLPHDFIPWCEESGLISPIGYWVLEEACRQLKIWLDKFPRPNGLTMSVNLSPKQLLAPDLAQRVKQIVEASGAPASSVILEITETAVIKNADTSIPVLEQLRDLGVRLHMDDFGTGYSSLSCLHRFPLTGLKIDRSFVRNMTERRDYAAIVYAIVALARNLGMALVAEGIENIEQAAMLQTMDCETAQGFLFSPALEVEAVEKLLCRPADEPLIMDRERAA
jgi:diguanylate cyclase (GGDEF)-like protein